MTATVETPVLPAAAPPAEHSQLRPEPPPSPEVLARTAETVAEGRAALEDATFDFVMAKPRRKIKFPITSVDDNGDPVVRQVRYQGLPPEEYDALVAAHPPTAKDKENNQIWNTTTFPPALIAAVSVAPKLTPEQAKAWYTNPQYSSGEQRELFFQALDACAAGLNVPFNAGD